MAKLLAWEVRAIIPFLFQLTNVCCLGIYPPIYDTYYICVYMCEGRNAFLTYLLMVNHHLYKYEFGNLGDPIFHTGDKSLEQPYTERFCTHSRTFLP